MRVIAGTGPPTGGPSSGAYRLTPIMLFIRPMSDCRQSDLRQFAQPANQSASRSMRSPFRNSISGYTGSASAGLLEQEPTPPLRT